ncbi:MAG: type II secretion system protein [Weeksellaceae bacterium]
MQTIKNHMNRKGFTLIELLVVIGILAVLLAITLIAINPAEQLQQAEDTKRRSDANAILNALSQFSVDNNGTYPAGINTTPAPIADTGADICGAVVPEYIAALPRDPTVADGADVTDCDAAYATGYTVSAAGGRVTVNAPNAQNGTITITR